MTGNHYEKDSNKLRFFDDDGYRQRAACICVRNQHEDEVGESFLFLNEIYILTFQFVISSVVFFKPEIRKRV